MANFAFENRIWDQAETMPGPQREELQVQRLRQTIARVSEVPFYKDAFARARITPDSINSISDIRRLPFTTKADLREHYPLGFVTVPRE